MYGFDQTDENWTAASSSFFRGYKEPSRRAYDAPLSTRSSRPAGAPSVTSNTYENLNTQFQSFLADLDLDYASLRGDRLDFEDLAAGLRAPYAGAAGLDIDGDTSDSTVDDLPYVGLGTDAWPEGSPFFPSRAASDTLYGAAARDRDLPPPSTRAAGAAGAADRGAYNPRTDGAASPSPTSYNHQHYTGAQGHGPDSWSYRSSSVSAAAAAAAAAAAVARRAVLEASGTSYEGLSDASGISYDDLTSPGKASVAYEAAMAAAAAAVGGFSPGVGLHHRQASSSGPSLRGPPSSYGGTAAGETSEASASYGKAAAADGASSAQGPSVNTAAAPLEAGSPQLAASRGSSPAKTRGPSSSSFRTSPPSISLASGSQPSQQQQQAPPPASADPADSPAATPGSASGRPSLPQPWLRVDSSSNLHHAPAARLGSSVSPRFSPAGMSPSGAGGAPGVGPMPPPPSGPRLLGSPSRLRDRIDELELDGQTLRLRLRDSTRESERLRGRARALEDRASSLEARLRDREERSRASESAYSQLLQEAMEAAQRAAIERDAAARARDEMVLELAGAYSDVEALQSALLDSATLIQFLRERLTAAETDRAFAGAAAAPSSRPGGSSASKALISLDHAKDKIRRAVAEAYRLPESDRKSRIRSLQLRWHPDKEGLLAELASEVTKLINQAVSEEEAKMAAQRE